MLMGILLLPLCVGACTALWRVVRATGSADTIWVALAGGAACWWAVYLMLPKPMRVYVFGHELTHALWTWLFGGSVHKFKVTSNGGHVVVTKTNFLIALAPYFFPIYAMAVLLAFCIGHWAWNWSPYFVWFHLLLGAAYAFHLTLTWHILRIEQTDITSQGYLFSSVIIFLGNIGFLLLGIPLLTNRVGVLNSFKWWFQDTTAILAWLHGLLR
jgi:peptidase M50B-like protein